MANDEFQTYTTTQAATLYDVSAETIRSWSKEFSEYLSATATPGENRTRLFRSQDMQVFSLVRDMKKSGATFNDIHASLGAGQRGQAPETLPHELRAVVSTEQEKRYVLQIEHLQRQLTNANVELERFKETEKENIRLQMKVEMLEQQLDEMKAKIADNEDLKEQLGELRGELKAVMRQLGQADNID